MMYYQIILQVIPIHMMEDIILSHSVPIEIKQELFENRPDDLYQKKV